MLVRMFCLWSSCAVRFLGSKRRFDGTRAEFQEPNKLRSPVRQAHLDRLEQVGGYLMKRGAFVE